MKLHSTDHGRVRPRIEWKSGFALTTISLLLLISALGCGARSENHKPVEAQHVSQVQAGSGSKADSAAAVDAERTRTNLVPEHPPAHIASTTHAGSAAEPSTRVILTSKGCVEFEPSWTTLQVGQSLSWRSELKTPVTIHVSSGAFDHEQYVVRPGAVVHTTPARHSGSYAIWTEPAACQTAPHGVQGPGPGLEVKASAQH